jgi:predicted  nucleic acid-binding Zn-ribbon protein
MEIVKNFIVKNFLSILIGLFIVYWLFFVLTPSDTMSNVNKTKLDSLTNVVNQIHKEQYILEGKIEVIDEEVEKIDNNISKIKTNKVKTGKKYYEEITRVDKYTEPELDSFFSNRYK